MSPPTPEPDQSSVQMDQSSALADPSSTTADTTPPIAAPHPDKHGDAMAETEQQPSAPTDHPMADAPDESDKPDEPDDSKPTKPAEAPAPSRSPAPSGFTPSGFTPSGFVPSRSTPSRPAFEREFTPPHLINIWSRSAWQTEHAYSNVHDHIRAQQAESDHTSPAVRRLELDVYKAADSCTLSLEYLVGHFSTMFFHHTGPENIMGMMATIDADATALDDLRLKQLRLANYGYSLEKKIIQTEGHIRELGDLAKRIRDRGAGEEEEEDEYEYEDEEDEDEDEDMDAEGESDPEVHGRGNSS